MAAPKQRRRQGNGPVSVNLIRKEAIRLFGEKTYPAVGMRDISNAVGLLPGSLYVHISSKEEILLAIVEQGIHNYLDSMTPIAESDLPASERLREAIKAHMRVLAATREQTRVTFHQWTYLNDQNQQSVIELRRRYEDLFDRIIEDGVKSGEFRHPRHPHISVLAIIGMLNSATEWYSPTGPLSADDIGEVLANGALVGLQHRPETALAPSRS